MTNTQTNQPSRLKTIALLLFIAAATYFLVTSLVDSRFNELGNSARVQADDQQELLKEIVKVVYSENADIKIESVLTDCSAAERTDFQNLLNRLNQNLSNQELKDLELLFSQCGNFDSESKLILVNRLAREIEVYETYVSNLAAISGQDSPVEYSVDEWKTLVTEEKKQAVLYSDLVNLQSEIITVLLSGKSQSSSEIKEILEKVSDVKGNLIVLNQQTETLRTELVPI